jgi:single-stranded DNA-binding protein
MQQSCYIGELVNPESRSMHINVCTIVGRVSKAGPQLRYSDTGTPVCSLVVEVDEHAGANTYTTYLPVDITGRYAESCAADVNAGDEVLISGKLKYKSVVDKRTQEKTSKLIVSTWGIQQRTPSESAHVERTGTGEDDSTSAESIIDPGGAGEVAPAKRGRPHYKKYRSEPSHQN